MKYTQRGLREGVFDDSPRRLLAAVLARVRPNGDLHEQPHDLLALLVRQSRVEAPSDLVEQCTGTLGDSERLWCLELAHAGFERGSLAADALEFAIGLGFAEMAADRETEDPLALGVEAIDRAPECDELGLRDRSLVLSTELCLKVREHVARVAQEVFDVRAASTPAEISCHRRSSASRESPRFMAKRGANPKFIIAQGLPPTAITRRSRVHLGGQPGTGTDGG